MRRGTLQQRPKGPTPIFPIHGRLGPQSWSWRWTHLAPPLTHSGCPTSPSGLHLDPSSRAAVGALTTPSEHSTLLAVPVCRLARPGASALEQPSTWLQGGLGGDRHLPAGRRWGRPGSGRGGSSTPCDHYSQLQSSGPHRFGDGARAQQKGGSGEAGKGRWRYSGGLLLLHTVPHERPTCGHGPHGLLELLLHVVLQHVPGCPRGPHGRDEPR